MYNAPYTDEQKEFIRQHCSEMTAAELVILFNETFHENRTKKGLQYFIRSIGLKCVCPENTWADGFTEEQKEFMRKYGGTISRQALTEKFNQHFGTSFSYGTIRNWCYRNKVPCINKNFRFTSETSPRWQKGMPADEFKSHYTEESFRRMTEPMRESNIQYHIGDEIIRHGLPCIVINEDFGHGIDARIEKKDVHIWKQHFGDIPKDCMLIHMDNNPMNCNIENLRCIPKKYRAFLVHNDWWNAPPEVKEAALVWCKLYYLLKEV